MILQRDIASVNPEALLVRYVDEVKAAVAGDGSTKSVSHANLDWPILLEAIAQNAKSDASQELIRHIPLLSDDEIIARRFGEIDQIIGLIDAGDVPVAVHVEDIDDILLRAERGVVLDGEDLLKVAANMSTFYAVRRFYELRQDEAKYLWDYAQDIVIHRDVERKIAASFDADGKIVDDASPELSSLRERSRRLSDSLRTRIEAKLAASDIQDIIQDKYYTLREGRYVLPIKAAERSKLSGIVHATSASGQTVFIEPAELVELNNALRMTDFSIEAEEQKILQSLTQRVGALRQNMLDNARRAYYIDVAQAVAQFAILCNCHIPQMSAGEIELYQARHPLLALRKALDADQIVVANDIMLIDPARTFVISGANAGGKTVNLKTVGLFALMIKAGIPICAGASSCFPIFETVFADIGDDQSIAQNISTFSAHVQSISHALPKANARALYLLDEPFSGTDPEHASPLVLSLTTYLHDKGATTFLTTHFENVKAFALETPWIASASVSFDMVQMKPTYHLQNGHPGTSAAFEIASQHGLPDEIVLHARDIYDEKATSHLEHAIAEIEKQRLMLEDARRVVEQTQAELETQKKEVEELREKMRAKVASELGHDVETTLNNIQKIKSSISKLRRKTFSHEFRTQTEVQEEISRETSALQEDLRKQESELSKLTAPPFKPLPEREIAIGKTVQIRQYRKNATILARSGTHVTLQLGILQVHASIHDLGAPIVAPKAPETARQRRIKNSKPMEASIEGAQLDNSQLIDETTQRPIMAQISENTLDLRGMTSDDAIEKTEFFLQSMHIREQAMCYIIHGHGTGVLKSCIRQYLAKSPLVVATRPGQYYEGGDGVTLAWLRMV